DLHLDRLPEGQEVLDVVDALAVVERRHLRDVQQAVTAGQHVDEGAELGDVDHLARVHGADLGRGRVQDQRDAPTRLFHRVPVDRTDGDGAHHAVVVDGDVRTGLLLEG